MRRGAGCRADGCGPCARRCCAAAWGGRPNRRRNRASARSIVQLVEARDRHRRASPRGDGRGERMQRDPSKRLASAANSAGSSASAFGPARIGAKRSVYQLASGAAVRRPVSIRNSQAAASPSRTRRIASGASGRTCARSAGTSRADHRATAGARDRARPRHRRRLRRDRRTIPPRPASRYPPRAKLWRAKGGICKH